MNMNKRQRIIFWAIVVLVLVVAGFWYEKNKSKTIELTGTTPIATNSTGTATTNKAVDKLVNDVTATSMTYGQAVAIFSKERIQFDATCRMIPGTISVKNGSTVMFDNRSKDSRSFRLDGTRYTIPGYGFKLLQLTAAKIPHIVDVDCGSSQNSGKIDLQ